MGDCDRMKKHISDYLEGSLDPTTRKEFEKNLEIYPELNSITKNISILPSILHQLPSQKCSEEFIRKCLGCQNFLEKHTCILLILPNPEVARHKLSDVNNGSILRVVERKTLTSK